MNKFTQYLQPQLNQALAKTGNKLKTMHDLGFDPGSTSRLLYSPEANPRIKTLLPIQGAGLLPMTEVLSISVIVESIKNFTTGQLVKASYGKLKRQTLRDIANGRSTNPTYELVCEIVAALDKLNGYENEI